MGIAFIIVVFHMAMLAIKKKKKKKKKVVKSGFGIYFACGLNPILVFVLATRKPFD